MEGPHGEEKAARYTWSVQYISTTKARRPQNFNRNHRLWVVAFKHHLFDRIQEEGLGMRPSLPNRVEALVNSPTSLRQVLCPLQSVSTSARQSLSWLDWAYCSSVLEHHDT